METLMPNTLQSFTKISTLCRDIYINKTAPPIHEFNIQGKIGIVNEIQQLSPQELAFLQAQKS